jgi:hypothetical protein
LSIKAASLAENREALTSAMAAAGYREIAGLSALAAFLFH